MATQAPLASAGVPSTSSRRRDIQGLRAVAVLVVVIFHAGLPLPGGFIGVDVFFVISGFVITAMLEREWLSTQAVRFGSFYSRRFKRLTPALALMVFVVTIASLLLLSPLGPQQVEAKTALGAMLLVANFVIAFTTGGYFDAPAETNPLLNTWSLSVEEQFYLVFPALLVIGWQLGKRLRFSSAVTGVLVALVTAGSFLLAVAGSAGWAFPGVAMLSGFYSPLTRAWEFGVGALLALAVHRMRSRVPNSLAAGSGALGVLLLALGLWFINGTTPFPGVWTLLPVVGTLLLIFAGTSGSVGVTRFLGWTPMVRIGDWSYSIYLWHWPLIVFAMYLWPRTPYAALVAAIVSFAPALLSYYLVEEPIRTWKMRTVGRGAALVAAVVLPPVLLAGLVGPQVMNYWKARYESGTLNAYAGDIGHDVYHAYSRDRFFPCTPEEIRAHALYWESFLRCQQSHETGPVQVAIVGDSHAEHLFLGLAEAVPQTNIAYYILGAMPVRSAGEDMQRILDYVISDQSISTVILTAHWYGRGIPVTELEAELRAIQGSGKRVFITDDNPIFPFDPVQCGVRKAPIVPIGECAIAEASLAPAYDAFRAGLDQIVADVPGVELLLTHRMLCDGELCSMNRGTELLYRDPNHLNLNGTKYVAGRLLEEYPDLAAAMRP